MCQDYNTPSLVCISSKMNTSPINGLTLKLILSILKQKD